MLSCANQRLPSETALQDLQRQRQGTGAQRVCHDALSLSAGLSVWDFGREAREHTLCDMMRLASVMTSGLWSVLRAYDSTLPRLLREPTKQRESPTLATSTCQGMTNRSGSVSVDLRSYTRQSQKVNPLLRNSKLPLCPLG